jgi:hypothetical protein
MRGLSGQSISFFTFSIVLLTNNSSAFSTSIREINFKFAEICEKLL